MVEDGTAGSFGLPFIWSLPTKRRSAEAGTSGRSSGGFSPMTRKPGIAALLAASRLWHPEAIAVVTGRLSAP
jgi:hypothetical protein